MLYWYNVLEIERKLMLGFRERQSFLHILSVHFRDHIVKLLIQLVREILNLSGESQRISEPSGCGNHVKFVQKGLGNILHIQY